MANRSHSSQFPGDSAAAYRRMTLQVSKGDVKNCPEYDCGYNRTNKYDLKDHINSKHIHYPSHTCSLCDEIFYTQRNLNRHKKSVHQQEMIQEAVSNGKIRNVTLDENLVGSGALRMMTPSVNESTVFLGEVSHLL